MARQEEPSYTELVHETLREARRPLTIEEIFDEVNRRRPITTRNPKSTIRGILGAGRQLVSTGDGRYGFLPQLLSGSVVRIPLTEEDLAKHRLIYPDDVRHALWPSFSEIQKRSDRRPVQVKLPSGESASLSLDFFGQGVWGCDTSGVIVRYLADNRVSRGDSLLVRVIDGEAGRCEAWIEQRAKRDEAAVAERNRELSDAVYNMIRTSRRPERFIWEIVVPLLAQGLYHAEVAPDPLNEVLKADPRFVDTGLSFWMLAEDATPETEALIRERKKLESSFHDTETQGIDRIAEIASSPSPRAGMERTMASLTDLLSQQSFASIDEANAFLQSIRTLDDLPHQKAQTPLEQAQELVWDAWEAPSSRSRIRLAKKALLISADCADAYVLLAEETARGPEEATELYAQGVAAGERALGEKVFKRDAGHFWGIMETRPYMRARAGLAMSLWAMDRREEAIGHAWEMLRLNPGDNQGTRYILLDWLLEIGDDAQVEKLLKKYRGDVAATWLYGQALHAFRTEGDTPRSRKLKSAAVRGNPHVPPYLLGRRRIPKRLPDLIGLGDEDEAVACAATQVAAWRNTPGALAWLLKGPR